MTLEVKYICPNYRSTVTTTDTSVAPLLYKTAFVNLKVSDKVSLLPTLKSPLNLNTAPSIPSITTYSDNMALVMNKPKMPENGTPGDGGSKSAQSKVIKFHR